MISNNIAEKTFYPLPSYNKSNWEEINSILKEPIKNYEKLTKIINSFYEKINGKEAHFPDFKGLKTSIEELEKEIEGEKFDFFGKILPNIQKWTLQMFDLFKSSDQKLDYLLADQEKKIILSSNQVLSILSASFFDLLPCYQFGNLSFYRLYGTDYSQSVMRLKCQLYYFYLNTKIQINDTIRFYRRNLPEKSTFFSKNMDNAICEVKITSFRRMEDSDSYLHVDFANRLLQIHTIIPSCTQEEIMFSLRPALFVALLISQGMNDNETILLYGCRKYCNYEGYLDSFKFLPIDFKEFEDQEINGIIAIDASVNSSNSQFLPFFIQRDIKKAIIGFMGVEEEGSEVKNLKTNKISTGNWGCGAFGGDPYLKFIQQIIAAGMVKKNLDYSVFENNMLAKNLKRYYQLIKEMKLNVGHLYKFLLKFSDYIIKNPNENKNFRVFIDDELDQES